MHSIMCRAASVLVALIVCIPAVSTAKAPTPSIRIKIIDVEPQASAPIPAQEIIAAAPADASLDATASDEVTDPGLTNDVVTVENDIFREPEEWVVTAAEVVPVDVPKPTWSVTAGTTLHEVVQKWADAAGWSLAWTLPEKEHLRIDASNIFVGEFKDAVIELFNALPPDIQIFAELRIQNNPPLIYVTRQQRVY